MTDTTIVAVEAEGLAGLPFEAGLSGFQQNAPVAGIPCFLAIGMIPLVL